MRNTRTIRKTRKLKGGCACGGGQAGGKKRRRRTSKKGSRSKTHKGNMNYTTKRGNKVFHRKKHYVRKSRKPFMRGGFPFSGYSVGGNPGTSGLLANPPPINGYDNCFKNTYKHN